MPTDDTEQRQDPLDLFSPAMREQMREVLARAEAARQQAAEMAAARKGARPPKRRQAPASKQCLDGRAGG